MTSENRKAAIVHEVRHGDQALAAARALRDLGLHNDALSRLYYAVFHFMAALLLTAGVEVRRHRALPGLLGTHFAGILTVDELARVARVATFRELADYERTWEADRTIVDNAFTEVAPLLDRVRALLVEGNWIAPAS